MSEKVIEVLIGHKIWVNVDGVCKFRDIGKVEVKHEDQELVTRCFENHGIKDTYCFAVEPPDEVVEIYTIRVFTFAPFAKINSKAMEIKKELVKHFKDVDLIIYQEIERY